ncbi:hypothetical protein Glove_66g128 [Diversispora epigaea]|uniref:Uncharacterized protein n=1 Tax=Diversispora epigaea TaxID=1348612 RepID=A0A397JLL7_9GLOM|nr:hypothetical protein Glove_66g128 [Diversispora epigaea]
MTPSKATTVTKSIYWANLILLGFSNATFVFKHSAFDEFQDEKKRTEDIINDRVNEYPVQVTEIIMIKWKIKFIRHINPY